MKAILSGKLEKYMRENDLTEDDMLEMAKKSTEINPNNQRSVWKAMRLQMYIQERLEEHKKGLLGKNENTSRLVCTSKQKNTKKTFSRTCDEDEYSISIGCHRF